MFEDCDLISQYTRQQALEDGVLIDLSASYPEECKIYRYPVACTQSVWAIIECAAEKKLGSFKGIVGDLLWMSQKGIIRKLSESTMIFCVILGIKGHNLKVMIGPADDMSPCVTVMLEGED
ncbi:MAG TPA: hypothetical protein HPP97_06940 [Desulfuromonadales bacterium]|nr:hypothetical protein [Desulfuromonadales bacterium]